MGDRPTTTVDLSWEGGLKFSAKDAYGHHVAVDAPAANGDAFDGFKPGELLLTSLAACSGIDAVGILRKQRQEVTGIDIRITGAQNPDPPWTWEEVDLHYVVRGQGLKMTSVERAIHLSETRYCSVGATIGAVTEIRSTIEIVED